MQYLIKNPTVRKVINRGFEPVIYHSEHGQVSGWIYKEGREYLYFYSPSLGNKRLLKAARRYMRGVR